MFRFFIPILILIFSGFLYAGYIQHTQAEISRLNADKQLAKDTKAYQKASIQEKVAELKEARDSITDEDKEILKRLIPKQEEFDMPRFINDMYLVGIKNGLVLKGMNVGGGIGDSAEPVEGYGSATMSFSVECTYDDFLDFLQALEQSQQLIDVTSITFTAPESRYEEGSYALSITVYWLP
jgi:Tfp pilus assembly protein PilO